MKPLKMIVTFWPDIYFYIDLFVLLWRQSVESNCTWRNSGQSVIRYFYGRCRPLFKIFVAKREIRKRYSFTWFSSRATSFDAHIEKRKRERERKSEVSGNERTQSICKCVHLLSRVWAIDGRLSRSCRGCSFDFNAQWTSHGISGSKHYKRCINNINNEMRILSLPRWLLQFNLDNSKLEEVKIFEL